MTQKAHMPESHATIQADRLQTAMDLMHASAILYLTHSIEQSMSQKAESPDRCIVEGNVGAARLGHTTLTHKSAADHLQ